VIVSGRPMYVVLYCCDLVSRCAVIAQLNVTRQLDTLSLPNNIHHKYIDYTHGCL